MTGSRSKLALALHNSTGLGRRHGWPSATRPRIAYAALCICVYSIINVYVSFSAPFPQLPDGVTKIRPPTFHVANKRCATPIGCVRHGDRHEWARRSGIDPPLASMAYQISGQARLSAAHGTEHASTPAGQADRCRQWQPGSQLALVANHRQSLLHRRMIHPGATACLLDVCSLMP